MKNVFARHVLAGLRAALLAFPLLAAPHAPAAAQSFPDSAQFVAASGVGGTAAAITIAVDNYAANLPGVVVRFMPTADSVAGGTTVNVSSVGAAALLKPNNSGLAAIGAGDLRAGQVAEITWDGTRYVLLNQLGQFTHASTLAASALSFGQIVNLQITASVGSNQLTVALKTGASGAASPLDPTAATPIVAPFRNSTIASGDPVIVNVTGALSLTVNSGNTMGCVSAQMCRLWVLLMNNAGTPVLGLYNALNGSTLSVVGLQEQALQTCASGTVGGSSAQTLYCSTSAVASKAVRYLGYVEIQETVAGTWATGATYVQLFGPGIKKPGDRVQLIPGSTTTPGTTTAASFTALTSGFSLAITPTSAANPLRIKVNAIWGDSSGGQEAVRMVRGGSTVVGLALTYNVSAGVTMGSTLETMDAPNSTTTQTYSFQGQATTGTLSFPYASVNSIPSPLTMFIEEIMGFDLGAPANDNVDPGVLSATG